MGLGQCDDSHVNVSLPATRQGPEDCELEEKEILRETAGRRGGVTPEAMTVPFYCEGPKDAVLKVIYHLHVSAGEEALQWLLTIRTIRRHFLSRACFT